jgi:hypothetical protein
MDEPTAQVAKLMTARDLLKAFKNWTDAELDAQLVVSVRGVGLAVESIQTNQTIDYFVAVEPDATGFVRKRMYGIGAEDLRVGGVRGEVVLHASETVVPAMPPGKITR